MHAHVRESSFLPKTVITKASNLLQNVNVVVCSINFCGHCLKRTWPSFCKSMCPILAKWCPLAPEFPRTCTCMKVFSSIIKSSFTLVKSGVRPTTCVCSSNHGYSRSFRFPLFLSCLLRAKILSLKSRLLLSFFSGQKQRFKWLKL